MWTLIKTEDANLYYVQLKSWKDMLSLGSTTFVENLDPRTDFHAWSACSHYDFLSTIYGIIPDAPGFEKVWMAPIFGELIKVERYIPTRERDFCSVQ